MDEQQRAILEAGEAEVARQTDGNYSKQPRFKPTADTVYASTLRWLKMAEEEEPEYSTKSRDRDAWLQKFWRREPHLAGVVNGVVLVDCNRGWSLTGGRNQVARYTRILHAAEGGQGWRYYMRKGSLSYWTTNVGFINENGRDGKRGPLRALYNVDPARCQLTGDPDKPLKYYPSRGNMQAWGPLDFFRVASLPSDIETFNGLGYCAIERAVELAKILLAVYQHDQEQLLAKAPRGLLLLNNISEEQWKQAMQAREARMAAKEQKYYGALEVLASYGTDQMDAKLVALSQLPAEFDREAFTDQLMYGYSLVFGYDATEFWVVNAGVMGRGKETDIQHQKATGKGGLDFVLGYQDRLQNDENLFPPTLLFEFDERDDAGEMLAAQVAMAKMDVVTKAYETGLMQGEPLISRDEARSLLVDQGVIPQEWTEAEEDMKATDEGEERARLRRHPHVVRALSQYPRQPIVRYQWPANRLTTLWESGDTALRPGLWRGMKTRQDDTILYQGEDFSITAEDVDRAVLRARRRVGPELAALLEAEDLSSEGQEAPA